LELFVSHQAQQSDRRLGWVIGGGESDQGGVKGRPDSVGWYTRTYRTCKTYGVPYFHKQMANLAPVPRQLQIEQFPTVKGTDGRLYVR
jgi:protein gp37